MHTTMSADDSRHNLLSACVQRTLDKIQLNITEHYRDNLSRSFTFIVYAKYTQTAMPVCSMTWSVYLIEST